MPRNDWVQEQLNRLSSRGLLEKHVRQTSEYSRIYSPINEILTKLRDLSQYRIGATLTGISKNDYSYRYNVDNLVDRISSSQSSPEMDMMFRRFSKFRDYDFGDIRTPEAITKLPQELQKEFFSKFTDSIEGMTEKGVSFEDTLTKFEQKFVDSGKSVEKSNQQVDKVSGGFSKLVQASSQLSASFNEASRGNFLNSTVLVGSALGNIASLANKSTISSMGPIVAALSTPAGIAATIAAGALAVISAGAASLYSEQNSDTARIIIGWGGISNLYRNRGLIGPGMGRDWNNTVQGSLLTADKFSSLSADLFLKGMTPGNITSAVTAFGRSDYLMKTDSRTLLSAMDKLDKFLPSLPLDDLLNQAFSNAQSSGRPGSQAAQLLTTANLLSDFSMTALDMSPEKQKVSIQRFQKLLRGESPERIAAVAEQLKAFGQSHLYDYPFYNVARDIFHIKDPMTAFMTGDVGQLANFLNPDYQVAFDKQFPYSKTKGILFGTILATEMERLKRGYDINKKDTLGIFGTKLTEDQFDSEMQVTMGARMAGRRAEITYSLDAAANSMNNSSKEMWAIVKEFGTWVHRLTTSIALNTVPTVASDTLGVFGVAGALISHGLHPQKK